MDTDIRDGLLLAAAVTFFSVVLFWPRAHGEDYWTSCEEAYSFCKRQPYHRDCAVWTQRGKPLSVNRSYYPPVQPNPNVGTQFCKDNPWHMRCGTVGDVLPLVHEHTECPIPPDCEKQNPACWHRQ